MPLLIYSEKDHDWVECIPQIYVNGEWKRTNGKKYNPDTGEWEIDMWSAYQPLIGWPNGHFVNWTGGLSGSASSGSGVGWGSTTQTATARFNSTSKETIPKSAKQLIVNWSYGHYGPGNPDPNYGSGLSNLGQSLSVEIVNKNGTVLSGYTVTSPSNSQKLVNLTGMTRADKKEMYLKISGYCTTTAWGNMALYDNTSGNWVDAGSSVSVTSISLAYKV